MISKESVSLINRFPRSMGHPRQDSIVYNKEEMWEYVKRYFKSSDIYLSVYSFTHIENGEIDEYSAVLDKVFFDFDGDKWLDDILKVHDWLEERNILHRVNCSGRGGHLFVFCKPQVQFKSGAIFNFVTHIEEELSVTVDSKIKGDLRRIFRFPNTFNFKGMRFCVPLTDKVLHTNVETIYSYAKEIRSEFDWFGKELVDLHKWDKERTYCVTDIESFKLSKLEDVNDAELNSVIKRIYDGSPTCIKRLMTKKDLDNVERYYLLIYLKEQAVVPKRLSEKVILKIMQSILSTKKFYHMSVEEGLRPFNSVMRKDYYIANCDEWKMNGMCPDKSCTKKNPRYIM